MDKIIDAVKKGAPIYLKPYAEPKVWGTGGIGEYWYGAELGEKSSAAIVDGKTIPMAEILAVIPEAVLGADVTRSFGNTLPLVKILTPKGRLSVQFHDAKNELWIVTGIDEAIIAGSPRIIIGFNEEMIRKYGDEIKVRYRDALEVYGHALNALIDAIEKSGYGSILNETRDVIRAAEKIKKDGSTSTLGSLDALVEAGRKLDGFYNYVEVRVGDVIPVPQGTLHALGPGIEVVEPQIPGPTQSLEDGATYPVRYYFPGYPVKSAGKKLDLDRIDEMNTTIWKMEKPMMVTSDDDTKIERLPGGFEDKGMEVDRISIAGGAELRYDGIKSYHMLTVIKGAAVVAVKGYDYHIPKAVPGEEMMLIPADAGNFKIYAKEDAQIIDTFTPIP